MSVALFLLTVLCFVWLGARCLRWAADRATSDPRLRRVILASYGVRIFVGVGLYAISYWHWPVLRPLQSSLGFWTFGIDAHTYHHFGLQFVDAWRKGIELPDPFLGVEYFVVVASLYRLLGSQPLYPSLFNGFLASVAGVFAYLIARRLVDRRVALRAAALVGFWPSSFIWSAQLLKDALSWFLIFASLYLILGVLTREAGLRLSRRAVASALLAAALVAVTRLRFYLGSAFSLAALATLVPAGGYALARRQAGRGLQLLGVALVVVLSTLFARTLNTFQLISPAHPQRGHFHLAVRHWQQDRLSGAAEEFRRAIELDREYQKPYLALGRLHVQSGELASAAQTYTAYLGLRATNPKTHSLVQKILARLSTIQADEALAQGRGREAIAAYERAVAFDPTAAPAQANLGLALSQQQQFNRALAMLEQALTLIPPGTSPEWVSSYFRYLYTLQGDVALAQGLSGEAIAAYERAVAFDPTAAATQANLRLALTRREAERQSMAPPTSSPSVTVPVSTPVALTKDWRPGSLTIVGSALDGFQPALSPAAINASAAAMAAMTLSSYPMLSAFETVAGIPVAGVLGAVSPLQPEPMPDSLLMPLSLRPKSAPSMSPMATIPAGPRSSDVAGGTFSQPAAPLPPGPVLSSVAPASQLIEQSKGELVAMAVTASPLNVGGLSAKPAPRGEASPSVEAGLAEPHPTVPEPLPAPEPPSAGLQTPPPASVAISPPVSVASATAAPVAPAPLTSQAIPASQLIEQSKGELVAMAVTASPLNVGGLSAKPAPRGEALPGEALPGEAPPVGRAGGTVVRSVLQMDEQILAAARETRPESLGLFRQGFVASGGYSLMDRWVEISTFWKLITYLPRALAIGLLAPFPPQWFDTKGSTGIMRTFGGVEMVLEYLLLPGLLLGAWQMTVRRRQVEGFFLLAFALAVVIPVSLVVANLGTLFRLRLLALLPLMIVVAAGDPIGSYRRTWDWITGARRRAGREGFAADGRKEPVGVQAAYEAEGRCPVVDEPAPRRVEVG